MTGDLTIDSTAVIPLRQRAKWRDVVARHELVTFFGLAFLFSWYPWVIALARGRMSFFTPR